MRMSSSRATRATERVPSALDIGLLVLSHEMSIGENGMRTNYNSARSLDSAPLRDPVPRFNLPAAMEAVMDDRAVVIPDFAASLTQITSDATRRVCEQGQAFTQTMSEWNTAVSHFLSRRVVRNGETIGRMAKCQNLPEVFAIQAQWVQDAADDYFEQTDGGQQQAREQPDAVSRTD